MSKWPKMSKSVLLTWGSNPHPHRKAKNCSKALPLSCWGLRLDGDKSAKEFSISKMLLLNIEHKLTYNYNRCQNAKNGYIL